MVLDLFGVPRQDHFTPTRRDLADGAFGALVLTATRPLDLSFPVMDLLDEDGLRYPVARNHFDVSATFDDTDVHTARPTIAQPVHAEKPGDSSWKPHRAPLSLT